MDTVISHQNHVKQYVEEHFVHDVIHTEENIITYKIYGSKE